MLTFCLLALRKSRYQGWVADYVWYLRIDKMESSLCTSIYYLAIFCQLREILIKVCQICMRAERAILSQQRLIFPKIWSESQIISHLVLTLWEYVKLIYRFHKSYYSYDVVWGHFGHWVTNHVIAFYPIINWSFLCT